MASINDFKANLIGGGARANQFRVTITPPPGIAIGLDVRRTSFMCKGTNLPAQELTPIEVPFRGRKIYIAGDREFAETWTTTFINDTDFMVRNALERWSNGINDLALNTGVIDPADYQTDLTVEQLDRDDTILKTYIFRSAWPVNISQIELTSEAADALEEFECTWRYQHFEASGVNF
ncbi:hypothetical protein HOE41_01315 [Candidatus Woesearchaeota archaeon]|jgi:hypothetical protein|nr:hypothetical protein [Candidatus Woesearchaeota archaeon]